MIENKEVMARNIRKYMREKNVNQTEICKRLGIKQNTFSDWVNGKTYPRIDKIQLMSEYFGVNKADLVEDGAVDYIVTDVEKEFLLELREAGPEMRDRLFAYWRFLKQEGK